MLRSYRLSPKHLRLWLLAAAMVLIFVSILEATHTHGLFVDSNDHCALCQQGSILDAAAPSLTAFFILFALASRVFWHELLSRTLTLPLHAPIRAPPKLLHRR